MHARLPWLTLHPLLLVFLTVLVVIAPVSLFTSITALAILFYEADFFGKHWFPTSPGVIRWLFGCFTILGGAVIVQTLWYYMSGLLGHQTDGASLITALLCFHALHAISNAPVSRQESPPHPPSLYFSSWIAIILALGVSASAAVLYQAYLHPALDPVRTPWALLPTGTALVFGFLAALQWLMIKKVSRQIPVLLITCLALASITLLIPLLYPLGFGFDGFLHRASEHIMLTTGTLSPKPFYYIGQYTFVTWLSRWLHLSIRLIDTLLVPLSALLLPLGVWLSTTKTEHRSWTLIGLISLLPLGAFITTTPQSFAYVLGIIGLCLALTTRQTKGHPLPSLVFGLWSVAAHPLAGLPFFGGIVCLLWINSSFFGRKMWSIILLWVGILGTIISVPLALWINGLASSARISWQLDRFFSLGSYQDLLSRLFIPERTHVALWADWATWTTYISPWLLLGFALYALFRDDERRTSWKVLIGLALGSVLMGAFLSIGSDFTFLISYERSSYAERLWIIARLFLLIPALHGIRHLAYTLKPRPQLFTVFFLCLFAAFQAGHIYASLPRHDAVVVGHGWSSGIGDREAVRYIEQNAGGRSYTVLANQQVSAVAIEQFGFKRYAEDIFYYPVPTGGPLYQLFLEMMERPTKETIHQAAALGQSSLVYVVLNDYWSDAERVAEELKQLTGHTRAFSNNRTRVYRFDVSSDKKP